MSLIKWNDNYSIQIKSVDDQHKELVDLVNQLHEAMTKGAAKEVLGGVLDSLVEYSKSHFKFEENLFEQHGYSDREAHKREHDKLTQQVIDYQSKFNQGKTAITYELMDFLSDWLINHILASDKKYSAYLRSKGVS